MQLVNYWKLNIKLVQNDLQGLISPSDLSRCLEYNRSRAIDFAKAQGLLKTEGDRKEDKRVLGSLDIRFSSRKSTS